MKRSVLIQSISLALLLLTFHASPARAEGPIPEVGSYLNGGIGEEERQAMRSQRNLYNLQLTFAKAVSGEFVTGVALDLKQQGEGGAGQHFDDCGPMFYIKLRPGTYRLSAEYEGRKQMIAIQVGAKGGSHYVYWR